MEQSSKIYTGILHPPHKPEEKINETLLLGTMLVLSVAEVMSPTTQLQTCKICNGA